MRFSHLRGDWDRFALRNHHLCVLDFSSRLSRACLGKTTVVHRYKKMPPKRPFHTTSPRTAQPFSKTGETYISVNISSP
jgi:hypothetical protein|eukprot:COSAG06_NODE_31_length_31488_cov_60.882793_11_plen_79_part_00